MRKVIWAILSLTTIFIVATIAYMSSGTFDPVLLVFVGWTLWPLVVLAIFSQFIFRKNFSDTWKVSLLVATAVFALVTIAIYIRIAFFPQSSTDSLGILTAPIIASIGALWSGGLVHAFHLLRSKSKQ